MKTGKELAQELNIDYRDFTGFLRTLGLPKFMGSWRFNPKQEWRIKRMINYQRRLNYE